MKVKNLIIGGGISGLTAAYFLKNDYLILEKESDVGGYCRTIKNDRYVWDYSGHFYHFKTQEFKDFFLSMVEPEEIITKDKITKIYYDGKLIDYPFQMNIHQLQKDDFIDCLYHLYTKEEKEDYDNFLEMLYGKFGQGIVERFLRPYNEKLYATDLQTLDTDAMGRFFPHADTEAIIRNMKEKKDDSYNNTFLYLKKGTQYFINKIYDQLDKDKVLLNNCVTKVLPKEHCVITNHGEKIEYDRLINTTPLNIFLKQFNNKHIKAAIEQMSYNKVLVLNIGFDRPSQIYNNEHWVYFPDKELNFYRIGFYNNLLGSDELNVYVEIGYTQDAVIDYKKELADTLKNMKKVGILDNQTQMIDYSYVIMDPAYVHISKETDVKLKAILDDLAKKYSIFTLGRYGKWTYCAMEDCMIWAKELADTLS